MELLADDLLLREPTDGDASGVTAAVLSSLKDLAPWLPWATSSYDEDAAIQWIRGELGDVHRFVMIDRSGVLVGSCGLNGIDETNSAANLGYWVRSGRAGRGFATTATRLLARHGLGAGGLHRLEVTMSVQNLASRRVAEKAGAYYEGIARGSILLHGEYHDAHVWSFVAGDRVGGQPGP